MKSIMNSLVAILVLGLAGCSAVYTTRPLGEKPVTLEAEDWQGTWRDDEGLVYYTQIKDSEKGILEAAGIEHSKNGFKMETFEGSIRTVGEMMFANLEDKDETDNTRYMWARVETDGSQITLWTPDPAKFADLVRQGKLPGKSDDDGDVFLGELEPKHLELIASDQEGSLFEEPEVLTRIYQRH